MPQTKRKKRKKVQSPRSRFRKYYKNATPSSLERLRNIDKERSRRKYQAKIASSGKKKLTPTTREKERRLKDQLRKRLKREQITPRSKQKISNERASQDRSKYHSMTPHTYEKRRQIQERSRMVREKLKSQCHNKMFENFEKSINEYPDMTCFICKKLYYRKQIRFALCGDYDARIFPELPPVFVCCDRCHASMNKNKIPSNAFWNKMSVPPIPDELKVLSEIEVRLLSRIVPFLKIINLKGPYGQFAFRGQAILFAQRVEEIAEQLPLSLDKVGVAIVSEIKEVQSVCKEYTVSLKNLEIALRWLKENNKLYKSIKIQMPTEINIEEFVIHSRSPLHSLVGHEHSSGGMGECVSAFTVINEHMSILRGTFHQGERHILGDVAGVQCTAIATTALLFCSLKEFRHWTSADINSALLTGTRYYCECISHINNAQQGYYLMTRELLPTLDHAGHKYNINVDPDAIIGITIPSELGQSAVLSGTYVTLLDGLTAFFDNNVFGVLILNRISIGIAYQNEKYWLFDSHGRGPKGFVAPKKGAAMVMSFSLIDLLSDRILLLTKTGKNAEQYVIASIKIIQGPNFPEPVPNQLGSNMDAIEYAGDGENLDEYISNEIETTGLINIDVPIPNVEDEIEGVLNDEGPIPLHTLRRKCAPPVSALLEKRAEELAWFQLFPSGENGQKEDRLVPITPLDYYQTRIMGDDPRFQQISYLFYALSMVELFKAKSNISVAGRLQQDGVQPRNLVQHLHLSMRQIRGTSAYWHNAYIQLLAMVRALGAPSWYLTLSCNDLNWPDLLTALLKADKRPHVKPDELTFQERRHLVNMYPVILSRHFMKRVQHFMKILKSDANILGMQVVDFWWRVEFQLRGSPHIHMVVWCENMPKFDTPEGLQMIDKVISCSSSTNDSELNALVQRLQKHRHTQTCYKKTGQKNCRFGFPREISDRTVSLGPDEAVVHGGRFCILKREMGDEMINNYNPILLKLWKGNIDIQPCGTAIGLAYYISKYIAKSEPIEIQESMRKALNEINNCQSDIHKPMFIVSMAILNQRQISACECAYRLCHLKMRDSSRSCVFVNNCFPAERYRILKINEASVVDNIFDKYMSRPLTLEGLSLAEFAVRYETIASTKFIENIDESSDEDVEAEVRVDGNQQSVSKYIVLLNGKGRMKSRRKAAVLRTRYFSQISNKEQYYYGLLVCHIPFRNESELLDGFNSASEAFYNKKHLLKPMTSMSVEDFTNIEREIHESVRKIVAEKVAANIIDRTDENINPEEYIDQDLLVLHSDPAHIDEADLQQLESHRMADHQYTSAVSSLNMEQRRLFSTISKVLTDRSNEQVLTFITGGAGSGKTFTLKLIVEHIYRLSNTSGTPVVVASPTAVAAKLVNGRTLHSVFKLPIERSGAPGVLRPYTGETLKTERAKWRKIDWLIIDEVSMVSYRVLRMIHLRLQELKENQNLYGSINVLLFGDLMQLPPVSRLSASYCFSQPSEYAGEVNLWRCFSFCELITNMRQQEDIDFIDLLNNLRVGQINMQHLQLLDERRQFADSDSFADAIRVFPTVKQVDSYNNKVIDKLQKAGVETFILHAQDESKEPKTYGQIPAEAHVPKDVNKTAGFPQTLHIGLGFRIMLRRNINVQQGLVNGSMGSIVKIKWSNLRDNQLEEGELPESVTIKFDDIDREIELSPHRVQYDGLKGYGKIERRMLPFILCWAVTVHKLQGITLTKGVVDLGSKLFAKGQAYVALSRFKSLNGLAISDLNVNRLLNDPHDKNCSAELQRLRGLPCKCF